MAELPIEQYLGFHDIPRVVFVTYQDDLYMLDCPFDEGRDDYGERFRVLRLDRETYQRFNRREVRLDDVIAAALDVGSVAVDVVRFDETRRQTVDDALFADLDLAPDHR